MLRPLLWAVACSLTIACTSTYTWRPGALEPVPATARPQRSYETVQQSRWAHLFLLGLLGRNSVDLRDVCPGPVADGLRTGMTVETTLVALFTLGIYTPLEHRFSCVVPPPGPLVIPRVVLEETAPLKPEPGDDPSEPGAIVETRTPPSSSFPVIDDEDDAPSAFESSEDPADVSGAVDDAADEPLQSDDSREPRDPDEHTEVDAADEPPGSDDADFAPAPWSEEVNDE